MEPTEQQTTAVSPAHHSTAQCFKAFGEVQHSLSSAPMDFSSQIDKNAFGDEVGRFRVWSANIGALQKGHSSLDYRLRESHLVYENILKLLKELFDCLQETCLVLSGVRLPYEREVGTITYESDDSSGSEGETSESSSEASVPQASTELQQRFLSVVEIIDTLYKMSRFIRGPAIEARISKANSFRKVDKDTGIDIFSELPMIDEETGRDIYSQLPSSDVAYVIDSICEIRRINHNEHSIQNAEYNHKYYVTIKGNFLRDDPVVHSSENDYIRNIRKDPRVARIAQSITKRRQQFQYWSRHREKLGLNTSSDPFVHIPKVQRKRGEEVSRQGEDDITAADSHANRNPGGDHLSVGKTAFTGTTATVAGAIIMTQDDTYSTASEASTARGLDGSRVDLPSFPKSILPGKDFECPYCFTICPSKYRYPKAWRAHLLRDLRPYICTYENCPNPEQRFATQREWYQHEERIHRRLWQCPEHHSASFGSRTELDSHIRSFEHNFSRSLSQAQILDTCQTVESDHRRICFLCFSEFVTSTDLQKHVAFHLERFSAFSLPRTIELTAEDEESLEDVSAKDSGAALGGSDVPEDLDFTGRDGWGTLVATAQATLKTIEEIWASPHDSPRRRKVSLLSPDDKLIEIQNMDPPGELLNSDEGSEAIDSSIAAMQRIQNEEIRLGESITSDEMHKSQNQIKEDVAVVTYETEGYRHEHGKRHSKRIGRNVAYCNCWVRGLARVFAQCLNDTSHPFLILSRRDQPELTARGYQVAVVDYDSQDDLRYTLRGMDLVISTVMGLPQIDLIDASAHAGVRRFVPAEFEGPPARRASNDPLDFGRKAAIDRLRHWSNHHRHQMKFTIFSCGVFYERFARGGLAAYDIGGSTLTGIHNDGGYLMNMRMGTAEVVERTTSGQPLYACLTSVHDVGRFIVAALDLGYQTWPAEFRMFGERMSITQILQWGAAVRGMEMFSTDVIEPQDLEAHLEHATYYQDYPKIRRIQELIATERRRYDFTAPNLNPLVHVTPVSFWNWLSAEWGPPQSITTVASSDRPQSPDENATVEGPSSAPRMSIRSSGMP
ncbi:hypothetical protein LSUE1_G003385 [Lachnellula suecica]|uniref:C2H2-type domain-containing protein n=1 Tax=Lachnellula suecica TaxID=602035 RepID=A0A8T9CDW2_9HELO|nr:hypothetical protein LSUE1_G003385 [Lachnellula suecica]